METTTTTGTGTVSLAGAKTGYRGFVAGAGAAAVVYYTIAGQAGGGAEGEWEVGIGTVTDAAPDTLSRTTILSSSNGGAAVDFSAGTKDVFLTAPAKRLGECVWSMDENTPSAAAVVDFVLPAYPVVKVVGHLLPATDQVDLTIRLSNDGGSTFEADAGDYAWGALWRSITGSVSAYAEDESDTEIQSYGSIGNAAGEGIYFDLNVALANKSGIRTALFGTAVTFKYTGDVIHGWFNSVALVAEVNNAIRFSFSSGNVASGYLAVYGYPGP